MKMLPPVSMPEPTAEEIATLPARLQASFARIVEWSIGSYNEEGLRPAPTEDEVAAAEQAMGVRLHPLHRQIYQWCNGFQHPDICWALSFDPLDYLVEKEGPHGLIVLCIDHCLHAFEYGYTRETLRVVEDDPEGGIFAPSLAAFLSAYADRDGYLYAGYPSPDPKTPLRTP